MDQVDANSTGRKGLWAALSMAAVTGAGAVTIALPATSAADPEPAPPTTTASPAPETPTSVTSPTPTSSPTPAPPPGSPTPTAQPGDPGVLPPPPGEPGAPPPGDPNTGRVVNAVGGFSFVIPPGWVESDASHLDYGSALLSKSLGQPPMPGQPAPVANDTRIVLGRLDQKLYASAEATNPKAAVRLGSDMGEFFMPYPGTRINQESDTLNANGTQGAASFYEVKFSDTSKPNGQIWTGVVGSPATSQGAAPQRWFVVWLGTSNDPVDKAAAKALAESILPANAPPAAGAPAPAAPAPAPGAPAPSPAPGAPAPAPGQAPAGEVTPTPTPTQPRTEPA
jgi:hypothetical protein